MNPSVTKQTYVQVPLAQGLRWGNARGEMLFEEKMDGRWHARSVGKSIVAGELMRGGEFYAFDVAVFDGEDVRQLPLRDRLPLLSALQLADKSLLPVRRGNGGEFLREILNAGGEGIVCKSLAGKWAAPILKCKRSENFIVRVTDFNGGSQSVYIADAVTGEARGKVALLGGKCDRVRVGSVLKLNGYGLTTNGCIREPRVDTDTPASWIVNY